MAPKVRCTNIQKSYFSGIFPWSRRSHQAVDGVSFELKSGDRVGIIGQNGAGKSTLLNMIAGISRISGGELSVQGKVTAVMTLGIGLREQLSGRENIVIDGMLQGLTKEEVTAKADSIIEFSELGEFIDRPVRTYSTGMKSRLAFAMLTLIDPEILIIDEALSAGDAFFARKASLKIKELCNRGSIVILVSHGMETIAEMCDRCIWLEKGKVKQDGPCAPVIKDYLESVRSREGLESIRSFAASGEESSNAIGSLAINGSYLQHTPVRAADGLRASIKILNPNNLPNLRAQLALCRLDSMIVDEREVQLSGLVPHVDFALETLILANGFYKFTVEIKSGLTHLGHLSQEFEVQDMPTEKGGWPMLIYPSTFTTKPMETVQ